MPKAMIYFGLLPLNVSVTDFCEDEDATISEISQVEKYKYCMVSLICGIFKEKKKVKLLETVEKWLPGIGG